MKVIYIITENKNHEKRFFGEKHSNFANHGNCLRLSILSLSKIISKSLYQCTFMIRLSFRRACNLETRPFENVKNQVGFCGIWCGSCLGGNGAILELTKRYEEITKRSKAALEKWAPKEFNFNEFMKGLACIQAMPLCPGCRKGGGNSSCKIRICALNKGVTDCSQCDQLKECTNFEELEKSSPKIKEGLTEIKNKGQKALVEKWMDELKTKWPHCVLLCASAKK